MPTPGSWRRALSTLVAPGLVCCSFDLAPQSDNQGCSAVCPAQGPAPPHSTTATSGSCTTWRCDPGWADCGNGACTVDLRDDPLNCGECSNRCGGSACKMGSCQQVDTITSHLSAPTSVAVDPARVYVADTAPDGGTQSTIESWPIGGGSEQLVATTSGLLAGFAVDPTGLYWIQLAGGDLVVDRASPSLAPVATLPVPAGALALGNGSVWWLQDHRGATDAGAEAGGDAGDDAVATDDGGTVDADAADSAQDADAGGAGPPRLADLVSASESGLATQAVTTVPLSGTSSSWFLLSPLLAVGGGDAFIGSANGLLVVRAGSSTAELLAGESLPIDSVAVDDSYVYWNAGVSPTTWSCLILCWSVPSSAPPAPGTLALRRVPRGGGAVETLAGSTLGSLVASGGHAWGVQGAAGDVLVRIDGDGRRTVLAGGLGPIGGVAVDGTSVYWTVQSTEGPGLVLRTAR